MKIENTKIQWIPQIHELRSYINAWSVHNTAFSLQSKEKTAMKVSL